MLYLRYVVLLIRRGSVLGRGPQTSALPPKCDIKHWLTNSKHRHRQEGAFCGLQNTPKCFRRAGNSRRSPDPKSAGEGTLMPQPHLLRLVHRFVCFWCSPLGSIWWGRATRPSPRTTPFSLNSSIMPQLLIWKMWRETWKSVFEPPFGDT